MTHDYKRNGTTTLFAALAHLMEESLPPVRQDTVIKSGSNFFGSSTNQHLQEKQLHLIIDNYSMHKHPAVERWMKRHPRFHVHFTPTSASWLNPIERFFRI